VDDPFGWPFVRELRILITGRCPFRIPSFAKPKTNARAYLDRQFNSKQDPEKVEKQF